MVDKIRKAINEICNQEKYVIHRKLPGGEKSFRLEVFLFPEQSLQDVLDYINGEICGLPLVMDAPVQYMQTYLVTIRVSGEIR